MGKTNLGPDGCLTWVDVLLGKTKVDNVDDLVLLHGGPTDEEVLGLDVPADEMKN